MWRQSNYIAQDGKLDVRLATSYLRLSRYDECAASARDALKKGGLKRPGTASELLGMCLFELDQFEEAKKAFRKAARDKKIERRARNWIKFIETEQARVEKLNESIRQARKARETIDS